MKEDEETEEECREKFTEDVGVSFFLITVTQEKILAATFNVHV